MENIELKIMWQEAHLHGQGSIPGEQNTGEIISMNHCKTIAKVLSDIRLRIFIYSCILSVFAGLMIYAFIYLGINFSMGSIVPFSLVAIFLLLSTTLEITRFIVFTRNADHLQVKESQNYIRKELNHIKTIDFLSYLILLYTLAIIVLRGYIRDIGGFNNFSVTDAFNPLILIFVVILLLTPWFLKYLNNQRYRKFDAQLNDSQDQQNTEF